MIVPRGLFAVSGAPIGGIFERHQAAALADAGLRVAVLSGGVITTRFIGRKFPYPRWEYGDTGPVMRAYRRALLPARWEHPMKAAARTYRRLEPLLEQYIARHGKPDIIHAHNLSSGGLIAMQASWKTGVPYVVTEHTGAYVANPGAAERDAEILVTAAKEARAVLAVGTQLADALRLVLGGRPVWVIPNVADSQLFEYPTRAPEGQFTVVGLGNLIPSKNYALLVKAFAAADLPPDSMLLIGGRGPEAGKLTDIARSLGIEDRVQLAGYLDRSAVASLFQRSHLFAHPSDSESFGVVLIEALALGLPVLATASSGPQDIVTPDVGLLTPVGDVSAFAKGLSDMYGRRDEFTPQRLRAICLERFGPEIFASRLLEVYREALA